jgi:DNA-directed RNA polymerase specialized sigma24 family protein
MESEAGSITLWLRKLKTGDPQAARELWRRLYPQLVDVAARYLRKNPDPATGPEDIAQVAFHNVCQGLIEGKSDHLENRKELWSFLFAATLNRVRRHYRDLNAQKRPAYTGESLEDLDGSILEDLQSPDSEVVMADLIEFLLNRLDVEDPTGDLRRIAVLRLDNLSAEAIAKTLRNRKTVVLQKIRLIQIIWQQYVDL